MGIDYKFDDNKLMYHPERIAEWMRDKFSVCPIYLEISLTNACNHKCSFCALDYCGTRKKKTHLDINLIRKIIPDLKKRKIKSILLAGAGEPVMHPDFPEITHIIKQNGIDCAVSTNMALYSKEILKETLSNLVWIRASL
ncbi:MAG TPA: radical SAM protein, partial [bacterium]|nr:radical SAM protein [bacterium]